MRPEQEWGQQPGGLSHWLSHKIGSGGCRRHFRQEVMVAEEGICVPQPLHLPSERPPSLCSILQGCHVPGMHTALSPSVAPSISSQPILLPAGSWEDWGALHGVRSCQCGSEEGAPSPRSMRAGRSGGAQPVVYTESAKLTRA